MKNINNLAPIALFVYNRLEHTKYTVEALCQNDLAKETPLFIFSDAPKSEEQDEKVKQVRDYIRKIKGFATVTIKEQEKNIGISQSIIAGVTELVNQYGKVIVIEDDIVTSPHFLRFMNTTLDKYESDPRIFSIAGFNYPSSKLELPKDYPYSVYFTLRPSSWGWGIWKNRWYLVDWEVKNYEFFKSSPYLHFLFNVGGADLTSMLSDQMENNIDAWDIRFCFNQMILHRLSVYPVHSYVNNIGLDGTGVHCGHDNTFENDVSLAKVDLKFPNVIGVDLRIMERFRLVHGDEGGVKFHIYALSKAIKRRILRELGFKNFRGR